MLFTDHKGFKDLSSGPFTSSPVVGPSLFNYPIEGSTGFFKVGIIIKSMGEYNINISMI